MPRLSAIYSDEKKHLKKLLFAVKSAFLADLAEFHQKPSGLLWADDAFIDLWSLSWFDLLPN